MGVGGSGGGSIPVPSSSNPYARPEPRGSDGVGEELRAGVQQMRLREEKRRTVRALKGGGIRKVRLIWMLCVMMALWARLFLRRGR